MEKKRLVGVTEFPGEIFEFGTPELGLFDIKGKENLNKFFESKNWDYFIRSDKGIHRNRKK